MTLAALYDVLGTLLLLVYRVRVDSYNHMPRMLASLRYGTIKTGNGNVVYILPAALRRKAGCCSPRTKNLQVASDNRYRQLIYLVRCTLSIE